MRRKTEYHAILCFATKVCRFARKVGRFCLTETKTGQGTAAGSAPQALTKGPQNTISTPSCGLSSPKTGTLPKGWFLAKVRDAIRMATWTRSMRRFLLNNGAASPSRPCAEKYGKTSKPPRFTNSGQEPKKVCNFVGGVLSPLLANIALHGLEDVVKKAGGPVLRRKNGHRSQDGKSS